MIINHNITSINANRLLGVDGKRVDSSMDKLSSGLRITSAGDDPSGLAVSEKMRSQIRGLNRASQNAADGSNMIQTAEGYLNETTSVLQRLRELSVQTSNGIYTDGDRMQVQVEVSQLVAEVDRIASQGQFNEMTLLTGRYSSGSEGTPIASMWIHVGANMDQRLRVSIGTMTSKGLGLVNVTTLAPISMSSPEKANQSIGVLDSALKKVSKQRADLGAFQERLGSVITSDDIGAQNLQASESKIRDLDMAKQMSELVKDQVLSQSAISMLAQSNVKTQSVLKLLG